jgi:hypothetical protein
VRVTERRGCRFRSVTAQGVDQVDVVALEIGRREHGGPYRRSVEVDHVTTEPRQHALGIRLGEIRGPRAERRSDDLSRCVGEFVDVEDLDADRLRALIQRVLTISSYRERARYFRDVIARARGLDVAADVIEHALRATGGTPSAASPAPTRLAPLSGKPDCQDPAARNVV